MNSPVEAYLAELVAKFKTGQAREHAYRPAFETLIHSLDSTLKIINDPSRSEHGSPDFVFLRGDITVGYTETKDIGVDLDKVEKSEQMERYLGYSNLILTDYLEFRFFRNGLRYGEPIRVGAIENGKVIAKPAAFEALCDELTDFLSGKPELMRSGRRLAEIMGGKARRIRDNVRYFLAGKSEVEADLFRIYDSVKRLLVHDLTPTAFADMYAQTLVYGLFVARYHDDSSDTFSRAEARDLVPESNPFLRQFFNHIAGPDFNKRLRYIVDELCAVFALADVQELMEEYFKKNGATEGQDPVIHFYEDFLGEYDAELRKKMGAYYTPLPVVRFIARAVDYLLKTDFNLADGLADTTKLPNGLHKVQVLDPAVGTGTFISAVIRIIYEHLLKLGQKGRWTTYVHHELLPRIHGFELMMAAYTIAHLKLSIAFKQTGFTIFNKRLGIYLTNSLEKADRQTELLTLGFSQSIAEEAKQAAVIKNETPIMIVLGNPPYSVSSSNKGEWIQGLIKEYKKGLGEKKINLDDDYIKFIRFAEYFVEKNGSGVVAMITNNSFIDGLTHRQMRKHLLETFDDIYTLDLHGNSKKKEKAPDGGKDENVFDIQQGVAISIFVRKGTKKTGLGNVHHAELFGTRKHKFAALDAEISSINWETLKSTEPSYFFVPKKLDSTGEKLIELSSLFRHFGNGIGTDRDALFYDFENEDLTSRIETFYSTEGLAEPFKSEFNIANSSSYNLLERRNSTMFDSNAVRKALYRPFDSRWIYYNPSLTSRSAYKIMQNLMQPNIALLVTRQVSTGEFRHVFVTKEICDRDPLSLATKERTQVFPLYVYFADGSKVSNLKQEVIEDLENITGKVTPEDVFNYIYAILHSPLYRYKYREFLKIDFPHIPYPKSKSQFISLSELGRELRDLHQLESPKVRLLITSYPEGGTNIVEKISRKGGKVYINAEQYFGNVPEIAWNFYIGNYQPAQKWLKDRKGRPLTSEDIEHYQKMIVALVETDRIMKEIDSVMIRFDQSIEKVKEAAV